MKYGCCVEARQPSDLSLPHENALKKLPILSLYQAALLHPHPRNLNSNHWQGLSKECEAQLNWEDMERAGKARSVRVCLSEREREIRERRESVLERRRRLVSPALRCLDKLQQQGAEDSAEMKQDAGSTQHFKEKKYELKKLKTSEFTVAKHCIFVFHWRVLTVSTSCHCAK